MQGFLLQIFSNSIGKIQKEQTSDHYIQNTLSINSKQSAELPLIEGTMHLQLLLPNIITMLGVISKDSQTVL